MRNYHKITQDECRKNEEALNLLGEVDQMTALHKALESNARLSPCLVTLNNYACCLLDEISGETEHLTKQRRIKQLRNARKILKKCIDKGDGCYNVYAQLGNVELLTGRYSAAISALEQGVKIMRTPSSLYNLGTAFYLAGNYDKAAETFRGIFEIVPKTSDICTCMQAVDDLFGSVRRVPLVPCYVISLYFSGKKEEVRRVLDDLSGKGISKTAEYQLFTYMPGMLAILALMGDYKSVRHIIIKDISNAYDSIYSYMVLSGAEKELGQKNRYVKIRDMIKREYARKKKQTYFYLQCLFMKSNLRKLYFPRLNTEYGIYRECHYFECPIHKV